MAPLPALASGLEAALEELASLKIPEGLEPMAPLPPCSSALASLSLSSRVATLSSALLHRIGWPPPSRGSRWPGAAPGGAAWSLWMPWSIGWLAMRLCDYRHTSYIYIIVVYVYVFAYSYYIYIIVVYVYVFAYSYYIYIIVVYVYVFAYSYFCRKGIG
jgi:hypothetical protein